MQLIGLISNASIPDLLTELLEQHSIIRQDKVFQMLFKRNQGVKKDQILDNTLPEMVQFGKALLMGRE